MEFNSLPALEWREGLIVVVLILAIYIAYVYLRMQRLKNEALRAENATPVFVATTAVAAYSAEQQVKLGDETGSGGASEESASPGELGSPEFQFPWNEAPAAKDESERVASLMMDVDQLRKEVGGLRAEVLVLREAVQRSIVSPPEVRQPSVVELIAPQYSEALQLAQREVDPGAISQQCGITRAEAELVAALARNRDN